MFLLFPRFQGSNCLQGGGGSNIVIFQGGQDSLPHTPSHHHHTHLDQQMPMSDILIALLKTSKEQRYWHRVKANWKYCASFSFMIKQVRGAAEFVCDENDQRLFTPNYDIKSWSCWLWSWNLSELGIISDSKLRHKHLEIKGGISYDAIESNIQTMETFCLK